MRTSARGQACLKREEGEVLRAYLCPAGHWTIGVGLTAASGVVVPKAGMVITAAESARLTDLALARNYEPAVEAAMSGPAGMRPEQHEFDAGVSFHFNTGAIGKATWVKRWKDGGTRADITRALRLWNKGGGKVLPGLAARRAREARMLLDGIYCADVAATPKSTANIWAVWGLALSGAEKEAIANGFRALGYGVGDYLDAVKRAAVQQFQRDHGLTADGIVGRATLATLQRRLDARRKAVAPVAASSVAAVPVISPDVSDQVANLPMAGGVVLLLAGLWGLWLAVRYRDVFAAKIQNLLPRVAALLRSF